MTVTYADLEKAPAVLLAGFEPEEESPIVFLRLRKAARKDGLQVLAIAPFATRGLTKMSGRLIRTAPGGEAAALDELDRGDAAQPARCDHPRRRAARDLARSAFGGKQIGGGDRRPARLGAATRRRPRRAGGRRAAEPAARRPTRRRRGGARADRGRVAHLRPARGAVGRDTAGILAAAASGELGALLIGGVELADLPDPDAALAAIDAAPFVVSLELRESAVTDLADVVFPVAPVVEKAGSFVNWEGRIRPFEPSLASNATPDLRVLYTLADEIGVDLGLPDAAAAGEELAKLGWWGGTRPSAPERRRGQCRCSRERARRC